MWKCPRCETLNDKEKCIICGEPMPEEAKEPVKEPEAMVVKPQSVSKSNVKAEEKKTTQSSRNPMSAANTTPEAAKPAKAKKEKPPKAEKVKKEKPKKEKKGGKGKVFVIILVVLALIAAVAAGAVLVLNGSFDMPDEDATTQEVFKADDVTEEETIAEELPAEPATEEVTEEITEKPTEKATKKVEKKSQSQTTVKNTECTYCGSASHTSSQHPSCSVCGSKYHTASYHNTSQEYCATCQKYTDHSTYEHPAPGI